MIVGLPECEDGEVYVLWRKSPHPGIIAISEYTHTIEKYLERMGLWDGAVFNRVMNKNRPMIMTIQDESTEMDFVLEIVKMNSEDLIEELDAWL